MPRASAASTIAPVLGPSRSSASSSRKAATASAASKRPRPAAAPLSCSALAKTLPTNPPPPPPPHLVPARLGGGRGARKAHRAAGLRLQCQRGSLQHMGQRDVAVAAFGVQRANGRKQRAQPRLEAGHPAHGPLGGRAVDTRLDGHVAAPQVRAAQRSGSGYFHGLALSVGTLVGRRAGARVHAAHAPPAPAGSSSSAGSKVLMPAQISSGAMPKAQQTAMAASSASVSGSSA